MGILEGEEVTVMLHGVAAVCAGCIFSSRFCLFRTHGRHLRQEMEGINTGVSADAFEERMN